MNVEAVVILVIGVTALGMIRLAISALGNEHRADHADHEKARCRPRSRPEGCPSHLLYAGTRPRAVTSRDPRADVPSYDPAVPAA